MLKTNHIGGYTTHPYPSPAPGSAAGRPSNFPPPLTLSEFKYGSQQPLTPHTAGAMNGFTAPLAPAQEYQISQMSAPADATTFSSSYLSRTGSNGVPSQQQQQSEGDRAAQG